MCRSRICTANDERALIEDVARAIRETKGDMVVRGTC